MLYEAQIIPADFCGLESGSRVLAGTTVKATILMVYR